MSILLTSEILVSILLDEIVIDIISRIFFVQIYFMTLDVADDELLEVFHVIHESLHDADVQLLRDLPDEMMIKKTFKTRILSQWIVVEPPHSSHLEIIRDKTQPRDTVR